jgi:hypothetical protein
LTKLLLKNIGLLIEVCKDGQFKVEVVVFTAVFGFINIEFGQIS